jgi:hypothetical protein
MPLSPRTLRPASSGFNPRQISGLALWLDGADASSLYTTDAGPVTAVSAPTEISGCVLWLDGADSSAASMTLNGSLVETWKDKSGSGNNVTASGGLRPTLTSNALNSQSVVTFGGSQGLTGNLAASISTNAYSVFAVCKITGSITNGRILSLAGAATTDFSAGSVIPCLSNGGTLSAFAGTQSANASNVTGFASYGIFAGVLSSNLVTNSANGVSAASANATLSTAVARIGVGVAAQGGAAFNTCDIAEVIYYSAALSTADRARVEAYLAAKWGISGVHAQATATSDPVGYWGDKSANGRHMLQPSGSLRPVVGSQGARKAISLNGTTQWLRQERTNYRRRGAFLVWRRTGTPVAFSSPLGANSLTVSPATLGGSAYSSSDAASFSYSSNALHYFAANSAANKATSVRYSGAAVSADDANNFAVGFRAAPDTTTVNMAYIETSSSNAANWAHFAGLEPYDPARTYPCQLCEVLFYENTLTAAQVARIERYLAAKWGITLAPQVSNADAQDWVNRVYANGGTVSASTASAVNAFCDAIDAASIRDRFYRLNLFCGTGLNACLVPLYRGPSLGGTQFGGTTDTNVGPFVSGDYAETGASGGLTGNGSSKYLQTGLSSSAFITGGNVRSHLAVYKRTSVNSGVLLSARSTALSNAWEFGVGGNVLGGSTGSFPVPSTHDSFIGVTRTTSTDVVAFRRTSLASVNTASASVTGTSIPFAVFARNDQSTDTNAYTANLFSNQTLAAYSIGMGLDETQLAAYDAAMQAFQTALSRNV